MGQDRSDQDAGANAVFETHRVTVPYQRAPSTLYVAGCAERLSLSRVQAYPSASGRNSSKCSTWHRKPKLTLASSTSGSNGTRCLRNSPGYSYRDALRCPKRTVAGAQRLADRFPKNAASECRTPKMPSRECIEGVAPLPRQRSSSGRGALS